MRRSTSAGPPILVYYGVRYTRRSKFPEEALIEHLYELQSQLEKKLQDLSAAIKAQEASGDHGPPNPDVRRLQSEARALHVQLERGTKLLQEAAGIPDALVEAIEQAQLPETDDRYWRVQVEDTPPSESLDDIAPVGLEQLLNLVDAQWLAEEAKKPYRLGTSYLSNPLHLVSGTRVGLGLDQDGPQRFARMLLVCQDHVSKRNDLDFFSAAMFVPEVAALGNCVDVIDSLGDEARHKFERLPQMDDDTVTSTVYELLVGAACVRQGLNVTMPPEDRSRKVPDYRVHGLGALPGAIECKRRLGLTKYELQEARHVESIYASIRPSLHENGIHGSIEVAFRAPVLSVSPDAFADAVLPFVRQDCDSGPVELPWGQIAFRRLPYRGDVELTRLYSPDFLEAVFLWRPLVDQWDGLLCEVEPPRAVLVEGFTLPLCFKWRSESEEALRKKTRGVIALWADAVRQIPSGEIGFIYIAYPEGGRPDIADRRTERILEDLRECWHRWSVRIPMTVVNRLYPRPLGCGVPDLIESVLPGTSEGEEFWLAKFPRRVFTGTLEKHTPDTKL